MTDLDNLRELWAGAAALAPARAIATPPADFVEHRETSSAGVAAALERLYADRALHREMAARVRGRALSPELIWEKVGARWRTALHRALEA
jgi:hypothetical protein